MMCFITSCCTVTGSERISSATQTAGYSINFEVSKSSMWPQNHQPDKCICTEETDSTAESGNTNTGLFIWETWQIQSLFPPLTDSVFSLIVRLISQIFRKCKTLWTGLRSIYKLNRKSLGKWMCEARRHPLCGLWLQPPVTAGVIGLMLNAVI